MYMTMNVPFGHPRTNLIKVNQNVVDFNTSTSVSNTLLPPIQTQNYNTAN